MKNFNLIVIKRQDSRFYSKKLINLNIDKATAHLYTLSMIKFVLGGITMENLFDFVEKVVGVANSATPMAVAVLALLVALSVTWLKRRD
jgi:orotate phosphoribosyltransferase-like protein